MHLGQGGLEAALEELVVVLHELGVLWVGLDQNLLISVGRFDWSLGWPILEFKKSRFPRGSGFSYLKPEIGRCQRHLKAVHQRRREKES